MSVWNKAISACRHNIDIPNKVTTEPICAYAVHNKFNGGKKNKTKKDNNKK